MVGLRPLTGDPTIDFAEEEYGPFPQLGPPSPVGPRPMSPLGNFEGPDLPGMSEEEITKAGSGIRKDFLKQPLEAASFVAPGGLLTRLAYQTGVGAGIGALEDPSQGSLQDRTFLGAVKGLGSQLGGEVLSKGQALAQGAYEGAKAPSQRLAGWLKENVPPLKDLTDLGSMIHGKGKRLVGEMMQKYEDDMIGKAGEKLIPLPTKDIQALELKAYPTTNPLIDPREYGMVDAASLIKKIKGKWEDPNTRDMYNRVLDILDSYGLRDEVAQAAFRNYMGIRDFLEETGALKGNRLDVAKIRQGLENTKIQDKTIGTRRMGNSQEGPLAMSVEGINSLNPTGPLGALGGVTGGYLGHLTGLPYHAGTGAGFIGGTAAGRYLGNRIGPLNIKEVETLPPSSIAGLIQMLLAQ